MRPLFGLSCATVAVISGIAASANPASAACTRLGFSVNDYGKDGPTNDAKELLDKFIAKKMAEQGVKDYRVGKKDVSCELFLNFIVFDEHTCRADATVCWDGTPMPKGQETANGAVATPPATKTAATPASPAKAATTTGSIAKPVAATAEKPAAAPAAAKSATPAAADAPPDAPAADASPPAEVQPNSSVTP